MKKLIFLLVILFALGMYPSTIFAQNDTDFSKSYHKPATPVELSIDNGILTLNNFSLDGSAIMEISPLREKTMLYTGTISNYDPINIENGEYLVAITESSDQSILYYHGILTIDDQDVYISMDSVEVVGNESKSGSRELELASIRYESEPNDTRSTADRIYNDDDVFGTIGEEDDDDWYKVMFDISGSANFWMGDIPDDEDFDLAVYDSSGDKIDDSTSTSSQELVTIDVDADSWYYIKAYGYGDSWSDSEYILRARVYPSSYDSMGWRYMYSASGPYTHISSAYGPRSSGPHCGFDITGGGSADIEGETIRNVYDGTCIDTGFSSAEGNFARVETESVDPNTGNNLVVHYKHMESSSSLDEGETVGRGDIVGYTGETGDGVTGPHLHFQVNKIGIGTYDYESTVNPILFYPDVDFSGDTSIYQGSSFAMNETMETLYSSFYFTIPKYIIKYIGDENFEHWVDSVSEPEKINIRAALEYFNIDKATFESLVSEIGKGIYDPDVLYLNNTELNTQSAIQRFLDEKYDQREEAYQH